MANLAVHIVVMFKSTCYQRI